jgi:Mrp family chromosome partitioning ATPase
MKFFSRKKEVLPLAPLVLPGGDGAPAYNYPFEVIDNLRYMVTRITCKEPLPARLAMVAALRQEGVTYLTQALATTIANDFKVRVCIVDLNWWWPASFRLAAEDNPGLVGVIAGKAKLEDVIAPTGWSNLAFVPAGEVPIEQRPVIARSEELRQILDDLKRQYDHLILDIPAVRATNDAIPLASLGDACCLVIRQGVTTMEDLRPALDEIDHLPMLGVILNKERLFTPAPILKLIPTA